MDKVGKIYLVGAGPGDKGLLTLKGKEILSKADVIVYDSLINREILDFCKESSELIYVGKKIGKNELKQKQINKLLLEKSKQGNEVVRLKGGDPFIFGRGGEETEYLKKNGIEFEVIPGVSSISAVPAYSGVPLTHRDFNSSFAVFTGHYEKFNDKNREKLKSLKEIETIIFLMGLNNLDNIIKNLLDAGRNPQTPVLIISKGTSPEQRSVSGTIVNIRKKLKDNDITTPAIIVVGEIIKLKKKINWYEKKPLFRKKIVVTRDKKDNYSIKELLLDYGATIIELPTINVAKLKSYKKVDKTLNNLEPFDYLIFTSVNGVNYFFERLRSLKKDSREFKDKKIITIGEKTALQLSKYNLYSDYTPREYVAESILKLAKKLDLKNKNILIPRAKVARDLLPDQLKSMGANVTVLPVYQSVSPKYTKKEISEFNNKLHNKEIDVITFTSSSTVRNFFNIFDSNPNSLKNVTFASIGPITATTLREHGVKPKIIAKKYTVEGLTKEIVDYYIEP